MRSVTALTPRDRPNDLAPVTAEDVVADLQRFETTILAQLENVGLPTEGVVVSLDEREMVLTNLGAALRQLPDEDRARSLYVSKMIVAAAVGLFDAALNYLWDETVNELRRRVVGYDLKYFFDIAVPLYSEICESTSAVRTIFLACRMLTCCGRVGRLG